MLVVEQQLRAQVFDSLGIDYCCHGNQTLAQACTNKSLDATSVLDLIDKCDQAAISNKATHTWLDATITELTHHIQNTHHAYLKSELPQLVSLANKVARELQAHIVAIVETGKLEEHRAHARRIEELPAAKRRWI